MSQHRVIEPPRPEPAEIAEEEVAFTATDFLHMIECDAFPDMRVELVGGRLIKMMPGGFGHGSMNAGVVGRLHACVPNSDARMANDLAVRIDELTVLGPDVAVLRDNYAGQKPVEAHHLLLASRSPIRASRATCARNSAIMRGPGCRIIGWWM